MRQDNLCFQLLLECHLAFGMVHRQSADVGDKLRDILRVHAAHSHGCTNNCFLVGAWKVRTRKHDIAKNHPRVRRVWADLGDLAPCERRLNPLRLDHGNHHGRRIVKLGKVDCIGNDVGDLVQAKGPVAIRANDLGAKPSSILRQL